MMVIWLATHLCTDDQPYCDVRKSYNIYQQAQAVQQYLKIKASVLVWQINLAHNSSCSIVLL